VRTFFIEHIFLKNIFFQPQGARTEIRFVTNPTRWGVLDQWTQAAGDKLQDASDTERTYQKGKGFLVAPMML
jgi:hypothetical protein